MLKKEITYKDFNGVERKETFCFHLTEAELVQMELETEGGFRGLIQRMIDAREDAKIVKFFKEFIDLSYGVLSDDGKYFSKTPEALARFKSTQAYSDLYMSLLNDDEAVKFIKAVAPVIPINEAEQATMDEINKSGGISTTPVIDVNA
jgi:hypothetical protein